MCQFQRRAAGSAKQVTVRQGPLPRLALATDGYAVVFRRLRSPGLSVANTHTHRHAHTLHPWWDTISTPPHSLFCCFPSSARSHTLQTTTRPPLLPFRCVCMCVFVYVCLSVQGWCAAIISNHVSVLSLGVCELPPPGRPICVAVAVITMASKLLLLPAASPPMMSSFTR